MMTKRLSIFLMILLFTHPDNCLAGWRFVHPMPHGRYDHDATLGPDHKIYVMGGVVFKVTKNRIIRKYNSGKYSTLVYDIKKDTWKYLDPVPGKIMPDSVAYYDDKKHDWRYVNLYHYEIHTREKDEVRCVTREQVKKAHPGKTRDTDLYRQGRGVAVVTAKDGKIWWLGGMDFAGLGQDIVLVYNPKTHAWTKVTYKKVKRGHKYIYEPRHDPDIPHMLERRVFHRAVVTSDGKIYVMGGERLEKGTDAQGHLNKEVRTNTVECYDPENKWEYRKPMKIKRTLFAAVVGPDDKIYVFGGAGDEKPDHSIPTLNTVVVYDPRDNTWSSRKPMPVPRATHAGVLAADGKIYIMGGKSDEYGPPLKDVFIYDPARDTWERGPDMNVPRAGLAAVATPEGKIYAIGGTDVGAYETRRSINVFLPRKYELYTGKVQDTVEVLDVFNMDP